jgi:hypothetical protein
MERFDQLSAYRSISGWAMSKNLNAAEVLAGVLTGHDVL